MTQSPTPPITSAEGLPIVAWQDEHSGSSFISDRAKQGNPLAIWASFYTIDLTPRAPAQARIAECERVCDSYASENQRFSDQIDSLRIENERLQGEVTRLLASWNSALTNYGIQKRERDRLAGEVINFESRIKGQREEINRLIALQSADQARDAEKALAFDNGFETGRLAALEEAAKVCEQVRDDGDSFKQYEDTHDDGHMDGCNNCAAAIRARALASTEQAVRNEGEKR